MGNVKMIRGRLSDAEWAEIRKQAISVNQSTVDWVGDALVKALPRHIRESLLKGAKP